MLAYLLSSSEHYVTCKKYDVGLSRLFQVEEGTCWLYSMLFIGKHTLMLRATVDNIMLNLRMMNL